MVTDLHACHLEFLVEEPSMKAFLNNWLPRVLSDNQTFAIHSFQGKHALLKKLEARLKGYASWMPDYYRILVVVDRDGDDCRKLKSQLEKYCGNAGLISRRNAAGTEWQVVTRIAIEELEAWYFGDWQAVRATYPRVPATIPKQSAYRIPDDIQGGTWEAFERILQKYGYFKRGLAKEQAAAEIGRHLEPAKNSSHSFAVFRDSIIEAVTFRR
ncbi:MAG: DUF4276 family protein [Rhodobacteraceae bacterium]|nr:DUF4276 family protein [Paracoccaceae bacterium]